MVCVERTIRIHKEIWISPRAPCLKALCRGHFCLGQFFLKTSTHLQRKTAGSVSSRMPSCSWEPERCFWERRDIAITPFSTVLARLQVVSCTAAGFVVPPSLSIHSSGSTRRDVFLLLLAFWISLKGPDAGALGHSASDLRLGLNYPALSSTSVTEPKWCYWAKISHVQKPGVLQAWNKSKLLSRHRIFI